MKYFMVAIEALDAGDELKLSNLLGEHSFGFWHRLQGVWIIITSNEITSSGLLDLIHKATKDKNMIAAEFSDSNISLNVPSEYGEWFVKHLNLSEAEYPEGGEKALVHATQK